MIVLVWLLNFGISWLNAWGVGKTWNETKHVGGVPHFMAWMGAIMSACGFSWCYMVLIGFAGASISYEHDDGTLVPLLTATDLDNFFSLGYLVLIFPILGSGLAITIHAWGVAWRNRTLTNFGVAGYDTFAMAYNIHSALQNVPGAFSKAKSLFSSDDDDYKGQIIGLLLLMALAGGILTAAVIIKRTARATALNRGLAYGAMR